MGIENDQHGGAPLVPQEPQGGESPDQPAVPDSLDGVWGNGTANFDGIGDEELAARVDRIDGMGYKTHDYIRELNALEAELRRRATSRSSAN